MRHFAFVGDNSGFSQDNFLEDSEARREEPAILMTLSSLCFCNGKWASRVPVVAPCLLSVQ